MSTFPRSVLATAAILPCLIACSAAVWAHGPHDHSRRQILGIHRYDPAVKPDETWGTYCVTELAPFFRDAIALNAKSGVWKAQQLAAASPAAAPATGAETKKITVFLAKKFVTMDPGWPEGTAVAVMDGKILSVGVTFEDLRPWLDKYPYEVDDRFKDKVIYPGFVEAHTHPVMGSLAISRPTLSHFPMRNPYGADIPGIATRADAIVRLKQYVAEAEPEETLLTWGYDVLAMGADFDRASLDAISATQPIIVWDASEHNAYANSAAIERYAITPEKFKGVIGASANPEGSSNGKVRTRHACCFRRSSPNRWRPMLPRRTSTTLAH